MKRIYFPLLSAIFLTLLSCNRIVKITNGNLLLEINRHMESRVNSPGLQKEHLMSSFVPSEYLITNKVQMKEFHLQRTERHPFLDKIGSGNSTVIFGEYREDGYSIRKRIEYMAYDSFPDMLIINVEYINIGDKILQVKGWAKNHYEIENAGDSPAFWTFQGSSSSARKDWILPVDSAFSQRNYQGMNNSDYGGGIPVIDLWRKDAGIAIGELELTPKLVSLPVEKDIYDSYARMGIEYDFPSGYTLVPNDSLQTYKSFVSVHSGDCFKSLKLYSRFMQASGIRFAAQEEDAYQPVWCAWGYERKATVDEILGTLSKVKELGLKWVDIDDGYQQAVGDWDVNKTKFPGGGKDMRKLVDRIHSMGLKAKLWWTPLAVQPSSQLFSTNPDIILQTADGAPQFITWWDSYYMSPSYSKTIDHTKGVLKMFIQDWDFDGLKMDGQHLNCVPPDYNHKHRLKNPEESSENLPLFYKMIYETVRSYKPHAVLQLCPCGDVMSFYNLPWINQTVASDPLTSWQIRLKGKVYKALLGRVAYYGDHVELSDGGNDFATQIGIGAVLGTKFTWPKDNPFAHEGKFVLTPEKELIWNKWISIYNNKMLSKEPYLGELYDIGYDKPEAHVISKSDTLFYAFYAKEWKGNIKLKGLKEGIYEVMDYVNGKNLGKVSGRNASLNVSFARSLLIEVYPLKK
jgi:alpha-galactosidase